MKLAGLFLLILSAFFSSKGMMPVQHFKPKVMTFEELELYVQKINQLKEKKQLTRFEYPGMTTWGSLTGYWDRNGLVMVHSRYNAEAGFREFTAYYYKEALCRIAINEHIANWAQYEKDHGSEEFDISRLTYTDQQYDYTAATELTYRKFDGTKMVASKADSTLYNELVDKTGEMQRFIEEASN